jgi:two-component system, OmpR family, phosphate regulon sensor histidine kinase PhoR
MVSAVVLAGLVAPVLVAVCTVIVWLAFGASWALGVLALGAATIVGVHLYRIDRLARWAAGPLDAAVPEGDGSWNAALAALHRRVRTRTAVQQDLARTIERFRSVAEAIPDGMIVLDATHRIQWANARAQAAFGLELGHDVGRPLVNLVRHPAFVRYLESGDYSDPVVIDSHRDPGIVLSIQVVPFGVEEKLLISRDITRVEAIERMRRDFIANVSHELKTPLTVISGFLETLQDLDVEAGQRARYLEMMREQAVSMQRLVDDLLTLSALESEHNPLQEARFPLAPMLAELAAAAEGLSGGRHGIALDAGEAATIVGSRDELASAFGNLVSNAVRYTPAGGTIDLRWRIDTQGAGEFSVVDSGIGIGAEHIPRLTERFYRVDRSRSRATGGTGLGLAIVKHVLLRHQAELAIASDPGRGSTFTVRLPAARVVSVAAAPGGGAVAHPASTAGR